jgi:hypothetical protein
MRLRKSHLVVLAALLGALIATNATSASSTTSAKLRPTVTVSGGTPLTVSGVGFLPRERVRVRVSVGGGEAASKLVRATWRGRFVAEFPGVSMPDCTSVAIAVVATGIRSTATASVRGRSIPPPCGFSPQP